MTTLNLPQLDKPVQRSVQRQKERLIGLDWLRAIAAILVVILHAAIPYMTDALPGLKWSAESAERSELVNLVGWWINGFIMPVFFVMTGFFAARLFHQRGATAFLKHRMSRIGGPLIFGLCVILPMDLYVWLIGWVNAGLIPFRKLRSLKIGGTLGQTLHGVAHLWYLEYVLLYCLGAWAIYHFVRRLKRSSQDGQATSSRTSPALTSIPNPLAMAAAILLCGSVLWLQPRIVIGFRHGWIPFWENLTYYAVPFIIGWFWEKQPRQRRAGAWQWSLCLAAASVVFVVLWPELKIHLHEESIPASRAGVPFLFAAFGLLMSVSAFGFALSLKIKRAYAVVSYLSKASFWIYLFHHPVVSLTHVDMTFVNWSPLVKFLFTTATGLTFCLLTYEGMVRTTWVGQLLNGYREPPRRRTLPLLEAVPVVETTPVPVSIPTNREAA